MMRARLLVTTFVLLGALGCVQEKSPDKLASEPVDSWAVTAWGERYEVFAECGPLIAGTSATCNAHVTVLQGFTPLTAGSVSVVLGGSGSDLVFRQDHPKRDGIYPAEVRPPLEGTFDLSFQVDGPAGREEIAAGRVSVGSAESPGGTLAAQEAAPDAISFLKEQQWRTAFATAQVSEGTLNESVAGPGRVTPPAGGEVTLTATFDATVAPEPWPYAGLDVEKRKVLFRLLPRVGERSLPELRAEATSLAADVEAAKRRVERLTELLRVEATSAAELERAQATLAGLEARLQSARQGMGAAGDPGGSSAGTAIAVTAPWSGRVAEVSVSPGQTVTAGTPLARVVKLRPLWIVLSLRPVDAARVQGSPSGLLLRRPGSTEVMNVGAEEVRIVSQSPEVDPQTASISLILEVNRSASDLAIGSGVEAELLLEGEREGIVIPVSALIDDSGVSVAYVQIEGESFARREVRVLVRQGERALVDGLGVGERLVTVGGGAIRRSSLLSSGAPEGHVH
ncbi:MAG: efflux RND transporter periplasmic adaptor subunit [Candidatus Polarisedimenticolia bacterium]